MKVKLVSVEEGVSALGFRRVAAVARLLCESAEMYFIPVGSWYSLCKLLDPSSAAVLSDRQIEAIVAELSDSDLVAFSSMNISAQWVERIARGIKRANPKAFIMWGGAHCILSPDEALRNADAVCTGEGEKPFRIFYEAFSQGRDYRNTLGMWFRDGDAVKKNGIAPLNSGSDLGIFPHTYDGFSCRIYDSGRETFRPYTPLDYVHHNGLAYRTLWTLGCPFSCSYCANEAYIALDPRRREIRYPPVNYLIEELETAIRMHPSVCSVVFYDDNFIAVPVDTLRLFCDEYRRRIGLPFVVSGMHPNLVSGEKLEMLGSAGMNRGRMGIQSGSDKMLSFYDRKTSLAKISESAGIISGAARKYSMIPPAFDIISDNPLAGREDETATLEFLYKLKRPYTLTVFSLRAFPRTRLWDMLADGSLPDLYKSGTTYLETKPRMVNVILYILGICRPPRWLFDRLLRRVRGYQEYGDSYPLMHAVSKYLLLLVRGLQHLFRLDFTVITGAYVYYLWKSGIIRRRRI